MWPRIVSQVVRWQSKDHHTHANPWNISIIVNQTPLMAYHVKLENMVVNLICVLVESTKGIYLVISAVCDRSIHQASRALSQSPGDFPRAVAFHTESTFDGRIGHEEGVIRGSSRAWGEDIRRYKLIVRRGTKNGGGSASRSGRLSHCDRRSMRSC